MATATAKKTAAQSAKEGPAAKKETTAKPASGKTLTLVQIGSPIGRRADQRATLVGLGLNKLNRRRTLQDSPAVRGMVEKVKHLVRIEE